jgi:hypothetical protein
LTGVWVVGKSVKQLLLIYIYGLGSGNKFRICVKHSEKLKIQPNYMPEIVRSRVGEADLAKYDPLDLAALLEKWCSEENKVGHELYYYFV